MQNSFDYFRKIGIKVTPQSPKPGMGLRFFLIALPLGLGISALPWYWFLKLVFFLHGKGWF